MNITRHRKAASVFVLVVSSIAWGCSSSSDNHHSSNSGYHNDVVAQGDVVERGKGRLNYRAPVDGTISVVDVGSNREVVSHRVNRGDAVVVAPGDDYVSLNQNKIFNSNMEGTHIHAIVFRADNDNAHRAGDYNRPNSNNPDNYPPNYGRNNDRQ